MSVDSQREETYNQSEHIRRLGIRQSDGICSGLIQMWTSFKLNEVESKNRESAVNRIGKLRIDANLKSIEGFHSGGKGTIGLLGQREQGNAQLKLGENSFITVYQSMTQEWPVTVVANHVSNSKKRSCFHLVVRIGDLGNHSCGIYVSAGALGMGSNRNVHFFDPNEGEYKVNESKFKAWIVKYFGEKWKGHKVTVLEFHAVHSKKG